MIEINQEQSDTYRQLRGEAIKHIRRYGARRETDYEQVMTSLIALEAFMKAANGGIVNKDLELHFAQAAAQVHALPTISDLMDHASQRFQFNRTASLFANLEKGGAVIQEVWGLLVQPESEAGGLEESITVVHPYEVKVASKTKQMITALLNDETLGVYADDLVIIKSVKTDRDLRRHGYTLIDIPRLNRQIAVCDQIGETTFAAHGHHPVSLWAGSTKTDLRNTQGIVAIRYDQEGRWTQKVLDYFKKDLSLERKKVALPYRLRHPLLTESTVVRWIKATKEKTGKWPATKHEDVWDEDGQGGFKLIESENWARINACCSNGFRGLDASLRSLSKLRDKHRLNDDLTEEKVVRWLKATYAKTGKKPSQYDPEVWDEDGQGGFNLVEGEKWDRIDVCCRGGLRGLDKNLKGLSNLKIKHGLAEHLNEEIVVRWLKATYEKTGKWPSHRISEIWDKDEKGEFKLVEGDTWRSIDKACTEGYRGLDKSLKSLACLKKKYGLVDPPKVQLKQTL